MARSPKNPFGISRPKNPFAPPRRPANPFKPIRQRAVEVEKPKNYGQAAATQQLALNALASGVCMAFTYEGLYRVVEVHTVGITRADRPAMNVWQVDGQSEDGPIPDWRTFCFDECFDVRLTDLPSVAPRPGYKKGAKQFSRILAEL